VTYPSPPVELLAFAVAFGVSYGLGHRAPRIPGFTAAAVLAVLWQVVRHEFNPFYILDTIGPWLVGNLVESRDRLGAELERRGIELDHEQARYRDAAVRLERTRIARELHDIVAHCLTVAVIQAAAGERLIRTDAAAAGQAFDDISTSTGEARAEIGRLVAMLDTAHPGQRIQAVDALILQIRATGLDVAYRPLEAGLEVPATTADILYRVVREAITNALKHAPGAALDVRLAAGANRTLTASVVNTRAETPGLGLPQLGGGHGLEGLRQRVAATGGHLEAKPTPAGGWGVEAVVPLTVVP
jgi:signal transduction histidine kinase